MDAASSSTSASASSSSSSIAATTDNDRKRKAEEEAPPPQAASVAANEPVNPAAAAPMGKSGHEEAMSLSSSASYSSSHKVAKVVVSQTEPQAAGGHQPQQQQQQPQVQEVSYTLQHGKLRPADGKIRGATLHVQQPTTTTATASSSNSASTAESFTVQAGDAITLLKLAHPNATAPTPHPALVVGFYSTSNTDNSSTNNDNNTASSSAPPGFTIRVRWLITGQELQALPDDFAWKGPLAKDAVLRDLNPQRDVILSPQLDDLPVQSIVGKAAVQVVVAAPEEDPPPPPPTDNNQTTLTCRYQLKLDDDFALHLDYVRDETAQDLEGAGSSHVNLSSVHSGSHSSLESTSLQHHRHGNEGDMPSSDDEEEDDDDEEGEEEEGEDDEDERRVVAEGEGSNLRTSIAVGTAFQANVKPFTQSNPDAVTRRPAKLVWKPGVISPQVLTEFLEKAALILNEFLRTNLLTSTQPYTPLPNERAEALQKEHPEDRLLTGSSLSTASVLSATVRRNTLLKECDVDRLLERIHDVQGDVAKALELVEQEPTRFICTWAQFEKEMFNDNFRRHHGAVRKIAKSVAPFKTIQEVIDYQYRFKIPDQFRLYQERKREIAARIVECIDHRRMIDPAAAAAERRRPLGSSNAQRWSDTTPADLARATEDRREKAKQLMVYASDVLGKHVIGKVANAIKELNRADTPSSRAALFNLLHGHTDLQRRFNEFLPKQT